MLHQDNKVYNIQLLVLYSTHDKLRVTPNTRKATIGPSDIFISSVFAFKVAKNRYISTQFYWLAIREKKELKSIQEQHTACIYQC